MKRLKGRQEKTQKKPRKETKAAKKPRKDSKAAQKRFAGSTNKTHSQSR